MSGKEITKEPQASIDRMTDRITEVLQGCVHSIWLYGSVVFGDFRPGWSDIDLIVLTDRPVTAGQAEKLLLLRQEMADAEPKNPYYRAFEGIITDIDGYRSGQFTKLVYWGTSGQRITDRYRQDAFSAYVLAKYGKSVYGACDRSIFRVPDDEEMYDAVRRHYETIRTYAVRTDESLYSCGWLLDIARCIYTLRNGGVIAKTEAALWALGEKIFPDEEPLRKALEIRLDPMRYRDRADMRQWLKELGPTVQRYADVLEREMRVRSGR